ncbi:hypothetical protein CSIM01_06158 [Colletotrichum simmondsii]|uniref:Uncharacterized protein n=1 Tax=Colletotrichum simmondsii TaxID=703756 RepID=A0A135SN88_9PEZI|nr:hypothetical protein CSIM01_06158 [Colletotrichum simmondsii]
MPDPRCRVLEAIGGSPEGFGPEETGAGGKGSGTGCATRHQTGCDGTVLGAKFHTHDEEIITSSSADQGVLGGSEAQNPRGKPGSSGVYAPGGESHADLYLSLMGGLGWSLGAFS